MGTLRFALLNALLSPLDEDAKLHTPRNVARDWLQSLVNDSDDSSDFRILDVEELGSTAQVDAELKVGDFWQEARLSLEFAQGEWAVTAFEWRD